MTYLEARYRRKDLEKRMNRVKDDISALTRLFEDTKTSQAEGELASANVDAWLAMEEW